MRILIISQLWEPEQGPSPWRMRRFVDSWIDAGHDATVVTSPLRGEADRAALHDAGRNSIDLTEPNLRVVRALSLSHSSSILSRVVDQAVVAISSVFRGLGESFRHRRPDIILSTVPAIPSTFAGAALSRLVGAPHIVDLRDAWPDLISEISRWEAKPESPRSLRHRFSFTVLQLLGHIGGWALWQILSNADHVISTSDRLSASLRSRGLRRVTTIRNSPVEYGTTKHRFKDSADVRSPGTLRVLYAGTIGRAQGLCNFIDALAVCKKAGYNIDARVIGSGAELGLVRQYANEKHAEVDFFVPVRYSEIDQHYEWCDTALVHLRDWEPLQRTIPSKLVEIMNRGIPVTMAADGEPAEIVLNTCAGGVAKAMDAAALANLWMQWAEKGVPAPDADAVKAWLKDNASPQVCNALFVSTVLETIEESKPG